LLVELFLDWPLAVVNDAESSRLLQECALKSRAAIKDGMTKRLKLDQENCAKGILACEETLTSLRQKIREERAKTVRLHAVAQAAKDLEKMTEIVFAPTPLRGKTTLHTRLALPVKKA
jgi:hypothetical protein